MVVAVRQLFWQWLFLLCWSALAEYVYCCYATIALLMKPQLYVRKCVLNALGIDDYLVMIALVSLHFLLEHTTYLGTGLT